jgi:uncharacterized protein involved in response to NO
MLYGVIVAAIAGFLLTAVPSWTGARGFVGWPLALLVALWAGGRACVASSIVWPQTLVAGVDLLFLPALAGFIAPPLIRARNRNTALLGVLAALWLTDFTFYRGLFHQDTALARHALLLGIDIVLLLITVVGGRIVPAFTSSALKQHGVIRGVRVWPAMTALPIVAMVLLIVVDWWAPGGAAAGAVALGAAVVQTVRLAQWQGVLTLRMPIVWVLHLGYLWLPVGLALKALALLAGYPIAAFYLHALTIGGATTLIMAVMSRASLGHTGRPLVVTRPVAYAYGLLTAAAAVRVFGPTLLPLPYIDVILLAAGLWTTAFALFLWVYGPILLKPRADGKPG